jgi:hypothetical protein
VREFLTPSHGNELRPDFVRGLYGKHEVTPYMHIMVYHVPDFIFLTRDIGGLRAFSTSAVELKNKEQVSYYFRRTTKGGGRGEKKLVIKEIMDFENRQVYYQQHNIPQSLEKPRSVHIRNCAL